MAEEITLHAPTRVERFRFSSFDENTLMPKSPAPAVKEKLTVLHAAAELPPAQPAPPPPPAITEKDVQDARSDAHAKGYSEGIAAAEAKINQAAVTREEAAKSLLDVIANRITIAAESHITYVKEQEAMLGKLVIAIAQKVTGEMLQSKPLANIESLLHECMGLIAGAPKISVVVSPTRSMDLKQRIDSIKPRLQGFEGELVVEEDTTLGDQDCRVEWKGGYGERNTQALWKSIEAIVTQKTINASEAAGDSQ